MKAVAPSPRRIKVLHVIGGLPVGGTEHQLLGLVKRMDRDRFDTSLCFYSSTPDSMEALFEAEGIPVIFFDKFSMPLWRFWSRLRRTIQEVAPDIVHTWLYSANFWGRWAAVTCGVRHLVASDRSETESVHLIDRFSEWLLADRTVRLANSLAAARSLECNFGLPLAHTRVIYNAVEVAPTDRDQARSEVRQELGLEAGTKLVLMVARLVQEKNYPMYIRGARRVLAARDDVVFLTVGIGALEGELRTQADKAGLAARMRFLGLRHDVKRLLAAADVFCLTSDREGFPNAMLEAMGAGLPVVCTRFDAVSEVLRDSKSGIIVPRDDDEAMARRVSELLDDGERRRCLGLAGRALVQQRYTWDVLMKTMESLYSSLVVRSSNQARSHRCLR